MKKLLVFLSLLTSLASCSNKYRSLEDLDQPPVIGLSADTLSVRINDTTTDAGLLYIYTASADNDLLQIDLSDTSGGNVSVYYDRQVVTDNLLPVIGDSTRIFLVVHAPGIYAVNFTLVDRFGKTATGKVILQTLSRSLPTASFTATASSASVYTFDGSASSDPYGFLIQYQYTIDGYAIYSPTPVIHQVFYQPGAHTVSLVVENDAQLYSQPYSQTLNVQ
jgi:hypothetical protein